MYAFNMRTKSESPWYGTILFSINFVVGNLRLLVGKLQLPDHPTL